jgi:hypothetical protein
LWISPFHFKRDKPLKPDRNPYTCSSCGKPRLDTQGVDVSNDQISIYADVIQKELGISCSSLSGANIANEGEWRVLESPVVLSPINRGRVTDTSTSCCGGSVAQEKFSETTIGYRNQEEGQMWKLLLGKSIIVLSSGRVGIAID